MTVSTSKFIDNAVNFEFGGGAIYSNGTNLFILNNYLFNNSGSAIANYGLTNGLANVVTNISSNNISYSKNGIYNKGIGLIISVTIYLILNL